MPVDHFPTLLLAWYDRHARALPWRLPPGANNNTKAGIDPYRIWLSEIMAQQTTIAAVIPYWQKFLQLWPTIEALAAAEPAEVMREWAGLGYYARARNMLAAARQIADQGGFPATAAAWQQLPGVGPYTAAAIAAITFEEKIPVIDTNVARILSRLFTIDQIWPDSRAALSALLQLHIPDQRRGDFAQGLMDLGATICTARNPTCAICPLRDICAAQKTGQPESWPRKAMKKPRPIRQGIAWWIESDGAIALIRRPERGLLGGMLALPGSAWAHKTHKAATDFPFPAHWQTAAQHVRHIFTHLELHLQVAATRIDSRPEQLHSEPVIWVARSEVLDAGLPTLYLRAAKLALQMEPMTT